MTEESPVVSRTFDSGVVDQECESGVPQQIDEVECILDAFDDLFERLRKANRALSVLVVKNLVQRDKERDKFFKAMKAVGDIVDGEWGPTPDEPYQGDVQDQVWQKDGSIKTMANGG